MLPQPFFLKSKIFKNNGHGKHLIIPHPSPSLIFITGSHSIWRKLSLKCVIAIYCHYIRVGYAEKLNMWMKLALNFSVCPMCSTYSIYSYNYFIAFLQSVLRNSLICQSIFSTSPFSPLTYWLRTWCMILGLAWLAWNHSAFYYSRYHLLSQ